MKKYVAILYDHLSCPQNHSTILGIYETKQEANNKLDEYFKNNNYNDIDLFERGIEIFE